MDHPTRQGTTGDGPSYAERLHAALEAVAADPDQPDDVATRARRWAGNTDPATILPGLVGYVTGQPDATGQAFTAAAARMAAEVSA